ncbi:Hsp70 family protein, partial [Candidatus Poribacteria bacterium]|nr:Hsp70 family protein [Candidatus Poribacteria bacterium]
MNENNVVAIDFGTSRTKLAYYDPKTAEVKLMKHGALKSLPSYFAVDKDGEILLGYKAQRKLGDESFGNERITDNLKGQISKMSIKFGKFRPVEKSPDQLLTALFKHLKGEAGKHLPFEREPESAYLTHPTTFSEDDEKILKNAAQDAGFSSAKLIKEPVAAAQFVQRSRRELPMDLIVLDCGAGTLHWTYMVLQVVHGSKPTYIIESGESNELAPGGTISGITEGITKRHIGGRYVERALAETLKSRESRITEGEFELLHHELKVRKEKFCRNPNDELPPIKIRDFSVPVSGREMKAAIEAKYITPACNEVAPYIKKVIDVTKAAGRKPALLLTGGCAQIKDFAVALKEKFGLDYLVIPEFEYATVQGALPLPEEIRRPVSAIKIAKSEGVLPEVQPLINLIKEKFDRFGNDIRISDTLANNVRSYLIEELVDSPNSDSKWQSLDIGGPDSNYLAKFNRLFNPREMEKIKDNISSHFIENLPDSVFIDLNKEVYDFFRNLDREVQSEVIEPLIKDPYSLKLKEDIKSAVKN